MKTRKQFLSIITGLAAGGAVASGKGNSARTERDLEMANLVLAKHFCVAMRRGDHKSLSKMVAPAFLSEHSLGGDGDLPIELAPVLSIHNIIVADDENTAMCLYKTKDGNKEVLLLRLGSELGKRYVLPVSAPDAETGKFEPWILRVELEKFVES